MTKTPGLGFASRLLRQEAVLSLGCTEPAAIALAAAAAAAALGRAPERVRVESDAGTFKNTLAVGLPGTSRIGPRIAAAAGAVLAAPGRSLRVFEGMTPALWQSASDLVAAGRVEVVAVPAWRGIRIEALAEAAPHRGTATIAGRHDRLIAATRDGHPIAAPGADRGADATGIDDAEIRAALTGPRAILDAHAELEGADLDFLWTGVETNLALARRSLERNAGLGLGGAYGALLEAGLGGPATKVQRWVAAGVESRMAGEAMPVLTSGGSGNSGLTVTLGTWAAAEAFGIDDRDRIARAVGLAHLVNVAVKARIGRVGPLCGGTTASSLGVACGLAWMLGGGAAALDRVIRHLVNALAGTVCDGAKPACAIKIGAGLSVAVEAALFATRDLGHTGVRGLGGESAEHAFERLERLAHEAYPDTDEALTQILQDRTATGG